MNLFGIGTLEILLILLVAFIILGPERMVDAAKILGKASREIRKLSVGLREISLSEEGPPESLRSETNGSTGISEPEDAETSENINDNGPVIFKTTDTKKISFDANRNIFGMECLFTYR